MSTGHDLGGGHTFTWLVGDPATHPTEDARLLRWRGQEETLVGIIEWHPDGGEGEHRDIAAAGDGMCGGAVMFVRSTSEAGRPLWTIVSLDPLDLQPSILCSPSKGGCGSHGWIRGGRWVGA